MPGHPIELETLKTINSMKPYSIIAKRSWIIAALALAAADADGDGFPDEGAEPVIHLEGLEGSAKRI